MSSPPDAGVERPVEAAEPPPDPRRWIVLAAVAMTALVVTIDNGVLTVAIPTIMKDFDTTLPSVQWVITGYSLVFASLLVIGGRLGDVFGQRRTFVAGASLFAVGSGLAMLSWSVPTLFVGEALIEGIGAAMLLPATISMISISFRGRERATAFAVWGSVIGVGAALGPVLGGFFTSELSWRWAFGVNLVVAPLAAAGVLFFLDKPVVGRHRPRIDGLGALLVSVGMFLLVFGISEGGAYGWWRPIERISLGGHSVWASSWPLSPVPFVFLAAAVLLGAFVALEMRKERAGSDPLFEFGQLRHPGFRYGLLTTAILSLGQLGMVLVLAVYLQNARGLSPLATGMWLLPLGVWIAIGARVGASITHRLGATVTVQIGLPLLLLGLVFAALVLSPDVSFWMLFLALSFAGFGGGVTNSQLTSVILYDIDPDTTGAASGMTSTLRQAGAALGVAIIGTILTVQTIHHTSAIVRTSDLPTAVEVRSLASLHEYGTNFQPPPGATPSEAATLERALDDGMTDAAEPALLYSAFVVALSLAMSFRIPRIAPNARPETREGRTMEMLESLESLEPVEPSREAVLGPADPGPPRAGARAARRPVPRVD